MPRAKRNKLVHAQITSPILVRKTILEGSILSVENLKILRNIKRIKKLKNKLKTELRKTYREMQSSITSLEEAIPSPSELNIHIQKESTKEARKEAKVETRKRGKQERLREKTVAKELEFEKEHVFDADIESLKEKIEKL